MKNIDHWDLQDEDGEYIYTEEIDSVFMAIKREYVAHGKKKWFWQKPTKRHPLKDSIWVIEGTDKAYYNNKLLHEDTTPSLVAIGGVRLDRVYIKDDKRYERYILDPWIAENLGKSDEEIECIVMDEVAKSLKIG